ncbi:MAG: tetratricopeptide repeat protein [Candidatus Omnitrophica bacterium]|nr:tetratricopeptide repeat protein [Candidatus Omnitrophota bacterium]
MNWNFCRHYRCVLTCLLLALVVGCGKPSPDELLQEGIELMRQQNFVSARHRFQEIADNYPDYDLISTVKLNIADCYALDGQLGKARTGYEEVAETYKGQFTAQLAEVRLGDMAKQEERYDDAESRYRSVIAECTNPRLLMDTRQNLADLYVVTEQLPKAVDALKEMVDASPDFPNKLRTTQTLANFLIAKGSPEQAWTAMLSIPEATGFERAKDAYYLSIRQTGIATKKYDKASQYFDDLLKSATDDDGKALALYNKALIATATTISRATGVQMLEDLAKEYPKTRWGRWAEVDAAKTIITASDEFDNPMDLAGQLLRDAEDNYDDIIADTTVEWFEPAKSANARFQKGVIQVMRGQLLEDIDDLKSASQTYAEIIDRFQTMPQIAQQANAYLQQMAAMVDMAEASGEEFWEQLRMIRAGVDPFAQSATAEAILPGATEEIAAESMAATGESKE